MEYYNNSNNSLKTNFTHEESHFFMDEMSEFEWFWPLFWTIASITTIDNLFVILLVTFKKKLHTKTNWFILSLSCADFIIGCVVAPTDYLVYKTLPEDELSHILVILIDMFFDISAVNLCLVAFDRYLAVVYPLKYVTLLTTYRVCGLIVLAWIVPALFSAARIVILFTSNTYVSHEISSSILVVLFQLLPMLFLIATFTHIACIVRKHLTIIFFKLQLYPDPRKNETVDFYPFVGYSPNLTAQGDLVYVNFGVETDYEELETRNISVEGKIVLARAPSIRLAAKKGAIGFISFPNPSFVAPDGTSDNKTYPNGKWLSKDAVQPWSAFGVEYSGDRLTPGLPATKGIFRKPYNESQLPDIPGQPISYGQAKDLLLRLKGH